MLPKRLVADMSHARRNYLVEHIDGPRRARASDEVTRWPLLDAKIVCSCDEQGFARKTSSIIFTMLTDMGRDVLAQILAEYAEALIRAGCVEPRAMPATLIPISVETVETRRFRGTLYQLVGKERTTI